MNNSGPRRYAPILWNNIPCNRPAAGLAAFADLIASAVAPVFGISRADIASLSRGNAKIALARQVAMYLARVVGRMQLSEIGQAFRRDRTTVAHACSVVEDRRDNPEFNFTVDLLERIVTRLSQISIKPPLRQQSA